MQEYRVTVDSQGTVRWHDLKTDKLHRTDGPAVEYVNGNNLWYINDKRHRVDGPAIERADGSKAWYLNDVKHTEEQFNAKMNPSSCEGKEIEIDGVTYTLKVKE